MQLTRKEVESLTAYLSKQFIDRSDNHLYNGEIIHEWLRKAEVYLEETLEDSILWDMESSDYKKMKEQQDVNSNIKE